MKKLTAIAMCAGLAITASGAALADGAETYKQACQACHMTGAAGSPKLGDKAAWGPRIAQGNDALYASALNGKNAMGAATPILTPMLPALTSWRKRRAVAPLAVNMHAILP